MIDHLGLSRMAVLLVVALLVFGPDKLPEVATQVGRALRRLRGTFDDLSAELRTSVGVDNDLRSLHPRAFLADLMAAEMADEMADEPTIAAATDVPAVAAVPGLGLPEGTDALVLLDLPVDLSSVEAELAALQVPAQG